MIRSKFPVLVIVLIITGLISCEKYLNVVPSETISASDVLGNIVNAEKIWANLYNRSLQDFGLVEAVGYNGAELDACTDECKNHWESPVELLYNSDSWSTTNNPLENWDTAYQAVRLAYILIENIDNASIPSDQLSYYKARIPGYKADAHFFIAMQYFELFRRYGAVPLIKRSYDVTEAGSVLDILRSPVDSVVSFITSQCDSAAADLPLTYAETDASEIGRITKGAAMSLKAITLLYAASPLFNGNTKYAGVKNGDGTQLFPQTYDKNKWKAAADAAKAVMDLGIYSLYNPDPSNPIDNYAQLFYSREYNETILPLEFSSGRNLETQYLPNGKDANGCAGHGKMSVFQGFVDCYEMNNGLPITDPNSGYQSTGFWNGQLWDGKAFRAVTNVSNMYKNRDPRFYATVTFNGEYWDSANHKRTILYSYYGNANGACDGWPKSGTNNETGYGWRKWCSPAVNTKTSTGNASRNYPIIRYPEILLAYAEAMNEYEDAPTQDVFDAINQVRSRVSMPSLPVTASDNTKDGLRERIHNEWRVEFAFENHRFWDVRRWLIAAQADNGDMYGLNTRPSTDELTASGYDIGSKEAGNAVFYKPVVDQVRTFTDRDYLFPIPQLEIDKNPKLVQNYGW